VFNSMEVSMAKHEVYENKTEKLIEPILKENHFELYDIEYVKEGGNWFLRIFIDKENGITVDDCELVSRALSDLLDKNDFILDAYILEVSSPGLGRQLKREKHFEKSLGEEVEIKLYKPVDKKKEFVGILTAYNQVSLTLELEDNKVMVIPRSDIAMVRLTFDF
jgi:ribosome maturation factor RimP